MDEAISTITQQCSLSDLKKLWDTRSINVIQFTDLMMTTTPSSFSMSTHLIDIFEQISLFFSSELITFSMFSEYLILQYNKQPLNNKLYEKRIPTYINQQYRRDFAQPPVILQEETSEQLRLVDHLHCNDGLNHSKKSVKKYNLQVTLQNKIICLFELTKYLLIYDENCNFVSEMKVEGKDEIIKTFKWSEKQKTVAAVFMRGLGFWSEKQNFRFGYHVGVDEFDAIEYVESLDMWVLIEFRTGRIFEFSIQKQRCVDQFINKKLSISITSYNPKNFIEIKYASLLGIVFQTEIQFLHWKKKQVISKLSLNNKIRNVTFSDSYHLLFVCCFSNKISLYQLNSCFCDFQEKPSKIQSKRYFVSCIHKADTQTLITYDEEKKLKLWNIKLMQCYQFFYTNAIILTIVITPNKLILGGKYLSHYCFENQRVQLRQTITCISISKDMIFMSTGNTLKCYGFKDGKMVKVIQGIFKKQQDIIYIEVDSNKGQIVLIGQLGSIQKRNIISSQTTFSKKSIVSTNYKYDENHSLLFQAQPNKLVIYLIDTIMKQSRIINNQVKLFCFDSFAGLMAVYHQSCIYVIKYATMVLTHWFQIGHNYQVLDMSFVGGTNSIIIYSKYRMDVLILGEQGKCSYCYRIEYHIPIKNPAVVFSSPQLKFKDKTVISCSIYIGTQMGGIFKITLPNLNISLCQPLLSQTTQSLKYKQILTTIGTLTFHFNYTKISFQKLKIKQIKPQRKNIQTNLKSIKSINIKNMLIVANVTKLMVFDKDLKMIGELDIEVSFPIKWFTNVSDQENNYQEYANKVLTHLGHYNKDKQEQYKEKIQMIRSKSRSQPKIKAKTKSFVTKEQFQQHRATHQNLFKSKTKTKAFQKDTEKFLIESKTMRSLVPYERLRVITEPSPQEKIFSRQRMISERLLGNLSKTIQAKQKIQGIRLNFDVVSSNKKKSVMELISTLDVKLKSSRMMARKRIMTEPQHRLPSISSRQKL